MPTAIVVLPTIMFDGVVDEFTPTATGVVFVDLRDDDDVCLIMMLDGVTELLDMDGERELVRPPNGCCACCCCCCCCSWFSLPDERVSCFCWHIVFKDLFGEAVDVARLRLRPLRTLPALMRRTVEVWCAFT